MAKMYPSLNVLLQRCATQLKECRVSIGVLTATDPIGVAMNTVEVKVPTPRNWFNWISGVVMIVILVAFVVYLVATTARSLKCKETYQNLEAYSDSGRCVVRGENVDLGPTPD